MDAARTIQGAGHDAARRFVMLDRDGVLIAEQGYLSDPDGVELLPGVVSGLTRLRDLGMGTVVVTNQSGIGRGYFGDTELQAVNARLRQLLRAHDVDVAGIYFCPHAPDDGCECRKPATGLVQQAVSDYGFQPEQGFVVGDRRSDIQLGQAIGATTFLVTQGYGQDFVNDPETQPDFIVDTLEEAAVIIEKMTAT